MMDGTYVSSDLSGPAAFVLSGILAFFAIAFIFIVIVIIAMYVLTSWAFMSLAKKTKVTPVGIAWIPVVGPALIASRAAKMPWWPILFLIGIFIPFIGGAAILVFEVFFIIWMWKTYEKIHKPGWWSLFWIIQPVGVIFLCIAAWSKK